MDEWDEKKTLAILTIVVFLLFMFFFHDKKTKDLTVNNSQEHQKATLQTASAQSTKESQKHDELDFSLDYNMDHVFSSKGITGDVIQKNTLSAPIGYMDGTQIYVDQYVVTQTNHLSNTDLSKMSSEVSYGMKNGDLKLIYYVLKNNSAYYAKLTDSVSRHFNKITSVSLLRDQDDPDTYDYVIQYETDQFFVLLSWNSNEFKDIVSKEGLAKDLTQFDANEINRMSISFYSKNVQVQYSNNDDDDDEDDGE